MVKVKHTPGPWKASRTSVFCDSSLQSSYRVAEVLGNPTIQEPEVAANARLIAAAPEMLDALDDLHITIAATAIKYESQLAGLQRSIDKARAAIAKATGEV